MKRTRNQAAEWPLEIKSGSAVVKVYCTEKANGYTSYCATFYQGEERKARFFQDLAVAKAEAKRIADEINQGEHISLNLSGPERLAIQRALEILAPFNTPIDS